MKSIMTHLEMLWDWFLQHLPFRCQHPLFWMTVTWDKEAIHLECRECGEESLISKAAIRQEMVESGLLQE